MLEPKRKNEDKRKSVYKHPTFWVTTLMIVIIGMVGFVFYRMMPEPSPYPAARLSYISDYEQHTLNLRTGERVLMSAINIPSPSVFVAPNREKVASWQDAADGKALVIEDLLTHESLILGVFRGNSMSLSWSFDSQWVVFQAYTQDVRTAVGPEYLDIHKANVLTGEIKRLTANHHVDPNMTSSPDGTQIAYTSAADGINRLYIMNIASGKSRLFTSDINADMAAWSPDGKWIAFMTTHVDPNGDIWIIRADGTDAQAITSGTSKDRLPVWLP